jgi:hypothetical protein
LFSLQRGSKKGCTGTSGYFWAPSKSTRSRAPCEEKKHVGRPRKEKPTEEEKPAEEEKPTDLKEKELKIHKLNYRRFQ